VRQPLDESNTQFALKLASERDSAREMSVKDDADPKTLGKDDLVGPSASTTVERETTRPFTTSDFVTVDTIGEGSYSDVREVFLANNPSERYALKIMDKRQIVRENKARYVANERTLLAERLSQCEGVVRLHFTFQDTYSLYMGLELCPGGDLYWQLQRSEGKVMSEEKVVFYVSELLSVIQDCHERGVIHRDVKPENVLLDATGHVKLCDFGSALDLKPSPKSALVAIAEHIGKNEAEKQRCASFVGTAEYLAPEILDGEVEHPSTSVDLWSIGVVTFQLLTGRVPFKGATEYLTMEAVLSGKYDYSESVNVSPAAKDFIDKLLVRDPKMRLGFEDSSSIRKHPFFSSIEDWSQLRARKAPTVLTATGVGSDTTVSESEPDSDTDEDWKARVNAATAALDAM
jgi:3-phosphoinositide dependent protein kinase-1